MILETERMTLIPLTARQLDLLANDLVALEAELGYRYRGEALEGFFLSIVQGQREVTAKDEAHYLYHTFWMLVHKADRVIMGSADFKAPPDENGLVEVGYGIARAYEGQGYITEAVAAMCDWALARPEVNGVIAETDKVNFASQRVLEKCGMSRYRETDTGYWWRLLKH